jgi:hypothetical protein
MENKRDAVSVNISYKRLDTDAPASEFLFELVLFGCWLGFDRCLIF